MARRLPSQTAVAAARRKWQAEKRAAEKRELLPPPPRTGGVTVIDPDNPFGCPAFDGPASAAGDLLDPDTYVAHDSDGDPVTLTVYPDRTAAAEDGVTCRYCREAVTPNGSGELANSEGRLACPAQPDTYHAPEAVA